MPSWSEYKSISKERGSLAFELYCVNTTPAAPPDEMQKYLPAHLDYQKDLEAKGLLFLAGPMSDETGANMSGAGLIIYRAKSLDEAKELAANDPMHKSGARSFTVRAWLVNEGSLSLSVTFAGQSASLK